MKTPICMIVSICFAFVLVKSKQLHACLPPAWKSSVVQTTDSQPSCISIPNNADIILRIDNTCQRHLRITDLNCSSRCVQTFDFNANNAYIELLYFDSATEHERIFQFELGTPNSDINQAFDVPETILTFETTLKVTPPSQQEIEGFEECERSLEEDATQDMNPMDMSSDMQPNDMGIDIGKTKDMDAHDAGIITDMQPPHPDMDMNAQPNKTLKNNEESNGCSAAQSTTSKLNLLILLAIFLAWRKRRD